MSMRVGLFGGTFDPMHLAHLRMACALRDELLLDRVHVVPADHLQPLRRAGQRRAGAVVGHARPAYTVETLESLRAELGDDAELWLLIGGDALAALHTWQRWPQLLQLANLAVLQRPDLPCPARDPAVDVLWQARQVADFSKRTRYGTIRALTLPALAVSATAIRQALAAGHPCDRLLAPAVLDYIHQQQLYCGQP